MGLVGLLMASYGFLWWLIGDTKRTYNMSQLIIQVPPQNKHPQAHKFRMGGLPSGSYGLLVCASNLETFYEYCAIYQTGAHGTDPSSTTPVVGPVVSTPAFQVGCSEAPRCRKLSDGSGTPRLEIGGRRYLEAHGT